MKRRLYHKSTTELNLDDLTYSMFPYWDLYLFWNWIVATGKRKEELWQEECMIDRYTKTDYRNGESRFIPSVAGELIASFVTKSPMRVFFDRYSDDGFDLEDKTDVKTVCGWNKWEPILKHPIDEPVRAKYYGLSFVIEGGRRGIYIGRVTAEHLIKHGEK